MLNSVCCGGGKNLHPPERMMYFPLPKSKEKICPEFGQRLPGNKAAELGTGGTRGNLHWIFGDS